MAETLAPLLSAVSTVVVLDLWPVLLGLLLVVVGAAAGAWLVHDQVVAEPARMRAARAVRVAAEARAAQVEAEAALERWHRRHSPIDALPGLQLAAEAWDAGRPEWAEHAEPALVATEAAVRDVVAPGRVYGRPRPRSRRRGGGAR